VSSTLVATLFTLLRSVDLEEYDQVCMDYSRDCERRADLCYTKVELMHRSCPKTCNVCSAAVAASAAAPPTSSALALSLTAAAAPPKKEPSSERSSISSSKSRRPTKKCRDVASDCDETADLCLHASFKKMMKCAKTCNFCPGRTSSSSSNRSGGGGGDDVLTISGLAGVGEVGDLPKSKSSTKPKSKAIDGLSISELVKLIRKAEETTETTTCADMAYDCPIKQGLCGNARYSKLMLKMCMRTCNLCTISSTT
ncbi:hypothetical protein PMAYCL1PPCAC_30069, partial [Pristionchus mayeri]